MNKWLVGSSKVVREQVADNVAMPEYMFHRGLTAFQVTTPRKVNFAPETVEKIKKNAKLYGIKLGFHAENYTSSISSKKLLWEQAQRSWGNTIKYTKLFNAPAIIHVGGNYWKDRDDQLLKTLDRIRRLIDEFDANPELLYLEVMGGVEQFGNKLTDLLFISKELGTRVCVDWAHLYAVHQSNFKLPLILKVIELLEQTTWKNEQWFHFSGMIYDKHGEFKHTDLEKSDFPYEFVLKCIRESNLAGTIITESGYENAHDSILIRNLLR